MARSFVDARHRRSMRRSAVPPQVHANRKQRGLSALHPCMRPDVARSGKNSVFSFGLRISGIRVGKSDGPGSVCRAGFPGGCWWSGGTSKIN